MPAQRWEDVIPRWQSGTFPGEELGHHPTVTHGPVSVGLWAAPALAPSHPGPSTAGGLDLLVSCWDACFEGGIYRFPSFTRGTVQGRGVPLPDAFGFADPAPEIGPGALVAVSRGSSEILLFPAPSDEAVRIPLTFVWARGEEVLHAVRVCDLDRDGVIDLLIGTDCWADYWPEGREWNDPAYSPYTPDGRWRGGPLRGFVYFAHNAGTNTQPRFEAARPLLVDGRPLEVYGAAAPAAGDFLGRDGMDVICGDFLDRLWYFRHAGGLSFAPPVAVKGPDGDDLRLPQNLHVPVAAGPAGAARGGGRAPGLLVGAEDGFVHYLEPVPSSGPAPAQRAAPPQGAVPAFAPPRPVLQPTPRLHPGVLPVPSVCDWDGDGGLDLIVGTAGGRLLWYPDLGGDPLARYGESVPLRTPDGPIRIQAGPRGSIQGPSEAFWGYLCPTVVDWDGDGRLEVLASDILGRHLLFARGEARDLLHPPRPLHYGGGPLTTVWRVRPAVVDWSGDGRRRYLCLDGDGLLAGYGQAPGGDCTTLTDKRLLRFADGSPIAFTEDRGGGRGRVKLAVCDWTGTGRGDLVVGTHARASTPPGAGGAPRHTHGQATVLLLENVGTPGAPRFAPPRQICCRGLPLRYGMHACSPEPVDWFRRGRLDLLVGAESGTLFVLRREWLSW